MRQFQRRKQYKAAPPYATITAVRRILADCDIFVSEVSRTYEESGVSSCRLWLSDPDLAVGEFGVNGKGMNPRYALASAYGELMERMQNFLLFGDYGESAYHLGLTKYMAAPDEVMRSALEAIESGRDVLLPLLRLTPEQAAAAAADGGENMACVPYYDALRGGTVLLPHKTLRMMIGSNGMAAGNTFREAVIQGLSEIYERAAVLEAYRDNRPVPQLHPGAFAGTEIHDRLQRLKDYGYGFQILDLSMGRGYPVIALRLEMGGAVALKAGADPCPVTALERCLTELFQGAPEELRRNFRREGCPPFPTLTDERARRRVSAEALSFHVDGSGALPANLFHPSEAFTDSSDFPGTDGVSDEDDLRYLLELTEKLGYGLYLRDWSFLGFSACQVIVPELSNYELLCETGGETIAWSFQPTVYRPDRCTEGCAHILNVLFDRYEKNVRPQDESMLQG